MFNPPKRVIVNCPKCGKKIYEYDNILIASTEKEYLCDCDKKALAGKEK